MHEPLDDKMFSVPDSILKHPLAVPTKQFLHQLFNPRTQKLVHVCVNLEKMVEDKESYEPAPYIPLYHEKKNEPPDKTNTAAVSDCTPTLA